MRRHAGLLVALALAGCAAEVGGGRPAPTDVPPRAPVDARARAPSTAPVAIERDAAVPDASTPPDVAEAPDLSAPDASTSRDAAAPAPAPRTRFAALATNDRPLLIGTNGTPDVTRRIWGDLDRIRLFSRALSDEEIAAEAARKYVPCTAEQRCVADWTFDVLDGGAFASAGPVALPAKLFGEGTLVEGEGIEGKALNLRTTGWLEVANDPAFAFSEAVTVTAWVRYTNTGPNKDCGHPRLIDKGGWLVFEADMCPHGDNEIYLNGVGPYRTDAGGSPRVADGWVHIAVTFDRDTLRLFKNGKLRRAHTADGLIFQPLARTDRPLRFGASATSASSPFSGDMDRIRIYDRALAAQEVSAHSKRQYEPCAKAGGCRAEWTFEKLDGGVVANTAGDELAATVVGKVAQVDGPDGKAVHLTGGYVEVADQPALASIAASFSYSGWLRWTTCPADFANGCTFMRIFDKGEFMTAEYRFNGMRILLQGRTFYWNFPPGVGAWWHLAVTFDVKSGLRIYQNGVDVARWKVAQIDNY